VLQQAVQARVDDAEKKGAAETLLLRQSP
jgi:hypothetical protein